MTLAQQQIDTDLAPSACRFGKEDVSTGVTAQITPPPPWTIPGYNLDYTRV